MNRLGALLIVLGAGLLPSCAPSEDSSRLIEQADRALLDRKLDEAIRLAKEYLRTHPDDASAHYVLGYSYRTSQPAWLTLADGEFETALGILKRTGRRGAISRFHSDTDLEFELHRSRALTGLQWILQAMDHRVRGEFIRKLAHQTMEHVQEGLRLDPENAQLLEMQNTLNLYIEQGGPPAPPPIPAKPSLEGGWSV